MVWPLLMSSCVHNDANGLLRRALVRTFDSQPPVFEDGCFVGISKAIVTEDFVDFCYAVGTDQGSATAQ
jgi:hypothetical protein